MKAKKRLGAQTPKLGFILLLIQSCLLCGFATLPEIPQSVHGIVFEDTDGDGVRDSGEMGIPGVAVTDQVSWTVSGEDGRFRFEALSGYGVVSVSWPDGYFPSGAFWMAAASAQEPLEFGLRRIPAQESFSFLHASDTHLSRESLPQMRRFRQIVAEQRPAFVLITGDLVRDALRVGEEEAVGYYKLFLDEIKGFPAPVFCVPGNHEHFGIERHRSLVSPEHPLYGKRMYRHFLGPNYYSFDYGGIHFIGLDTASVDDLWYYGKVDERQIEWLKGDLKRVAPTRPVVTFNHIPFFTSILTLWGYDEDLVAPTLIKVDGKRQFRHVVSNASQVLEVLQARNYELALGGHNHARESLRFVTKGKPIRFDGAAAVVGSSTPIPQMEMLAGVTLYRVRQGEIDEGEFLPLGGN